MLTIFYSRRLSILFLLKVIRTLHITTDQLIANDDENNGILILTAAAAAVAAVTVTVAFDDARKSAILFSDVEKSRQWASCGP